MSDRKAVEIQNLAFIYECNLKYLPENLRELDAIDIESVRKAEIDPKLKALSDISLKIEKGEFIGLVGNTGSGKSSLVRTLNGLIPKFYNGLFFGYVHIGDKDTVEFDIPELSLEVGVMFQNPENQLIAMTVEREIAMGLENRGVNRKKIRDKIDEVLSYMGIEHLRKRRPYELSGGEQQKVAIASILAIEPDIIVLDEPTAALDPIAAQNIILLVEKLQREQGLTVIVIEHRLQMILEHCDRLMIMREGEVIAFDDVNTIMNEDMIYETGIEVPEFCVFFKNLRDQGVYCGDIPTDLDNASKKLMEMLG